MLRPLKPWLIGTLLTLAPVIARAQEQTHAYPECNREPTEGDTAAAKGAFQAGQGSFNEADYERAITYWEDAYRRDCTADALLLNLARAYELSGQKRQAVIALETYLAKKPDSGQRDQIQRRIEVLNKQIASEPVTPVPSQTPGPTPGPVAPGVTPEPAAPVETAGKRPIFPLIIAGVGGGVAIVGGILYLGARSDLSDFEDKCQDSKCVDQAQADEGNDARTKVNITGAVTIGGLVIAAGGLVWYFASSPDGGSSSSGARTRSLARLPQISPSVGKGFAGLSYSGAF